MTKFDSKALIAQTKEMNKAIAKLREEYREKIKVTFAEATKGFFEITPEVTALEWTQYSPHWNDGEECYFSVNEVYYYLEGQEPGDFSYAEEAGFNAFSFKDEGDLLQAIEELNAVINGPDLTEAQVDASRHRWDISESKYVGYRGANSSSYQTTFSREKAKRRFAELEEQLEETRKMAPIFARREEIEANIEAITSLISSIDNDAMEDMFGNHVKVTVTKNGVEVDEYEHD